jgi:hypothetical protein
MKDRILRIGGYFTDTYKLWEANEGIVAEFTDSEIYGNMIIMEQEAALAPRVEKTAVEARAQMRD